MDKPTQTIILDIHGEPARAGMRAIHWGEDEPDRVFIGTIGEWIVKVSGKIIDHELVFVYDDPPANSDEREYVPLEVVGRFELVAVMESVDETREWMLACNTKGVPLYWVAADGERREPNDQPPRREWSKEMQAVGYCSCCGAPRIYGRMVHDQECIWFGDMCRDQPAEVKHP